jgi:hypothetical protein
VDPGEPFVRRRTWGRWDKLWALGGALFYGLPCWLPAIGLLVGPSREPVLALVFGILFLAVGAFIWRLHSHDAGALEAEITTDGVRFTDSQQPVPWAKVAWVGFVHTPGGTYTMSGDDVVLELTDGARLRHRLDGVLWIEVIQAIHRLVPEKLATPPTTGVD